MNLAKNPSINVAKNDAAVGVAAGCAAWHNDKMCRKCQTGEVDPGDGGEVERGAQQQVTPSYNGLALIWKLKWA